MVSVYLVSDTNSRVRIINPVPFSPDPTRTELNLMPWTYFANMTDVDLAAIYAFLQTVPAMGD